MKFKDLKIGMKLAIGFTIVNIIMAIVAFTGLRTLKVITHRVTDEVKAFQMTCKNFGSRTIAIRELFLITKIKDAQSHEEVQEIHEP